MENKTILSRSRRVLPGVAIFILIGLATPGYPFHSGGVGECEGCHTVHNSQGGTPLTSTANPVGMANANLLLGSDSSSTCLSCHAAPESAPTGHHVMTVPFLQTTLPAGMTPGGDFTWLAKSYTWTSGSPPTPGGSEGQRHGHNVAATDYGIFSDTRTTVAPGGTYPATSLGCISCHDPHGRSRMMDTAGNFSTTGKPIRTSGSYGEDPDGRFAVGAYRILGGAGYRPLSLPGVPQFTNRPMIAASPVTYNRSEGVPGNQVRVAYGRGTTDWCTNCHTGMHGGGAAGSFQHPSDRAIGSTIAANYNAYIMTGNMTGNGTTAFTSLVPFQHTNLSQNSVLATFRPLRSGPMGGDRVTCLTCHRAHASGWDSALRFNNVSEFLTVADSAGIAVYPDPAANPAQAMGRTIQETQRAYYDRPANTFSPFQRALCNKCHPAD